MAVERIVQNILRELAETSGVSGFRKLSLLRRAFLSGLINSPNPEEFLSRVVMELGTGLELPSSARAKMLLLAPAVRGSKIPASLWLKAYSDSPEVLGAIATGHLPVVPFKLSEVVVRPTGEELMLGGVGGLSRAVKILPEEPIDELYREIGQDILEFLKKNEKLPLGARELKALARGALQFRNLPPNLVTIPTTGMIKVSLPSWKTPADIPFDRETRDVMSWFSRVIGSIRGQPPEEVLREAYMVGEASAAAAFLSPVGLVRAATSLIGEEVPRAELSKALLSGVAFGERAMGIAREISEFPMLSPRGQVNLVRSLAAMEYLWQQMNDLGISGAAIGIKNARYWAALRSVTDMTSVLDYLIEFPEREILEQTVPMTFKIARKAVEEQEVAAIGLRPIGRAVKRVPSVLRPSVEEVGVPSTEINLPEVLGDALRAMAAMPSDEAIRFYKGLTRAVARNDVPAVVEILSSLPDEAVGRLSESSQKAIAALKTASAMGEATYKAYWGATPSGRRRLAETLEEAAERSKEAPIRQKWRDVLQYLGDLSEDEKALVFRLDAYSIWRFAEDPQALAGVLKQLVSEVNARTGNMRYSAAILRRVNTALKGAKFKTFEEMVSALRKATEAELGRRGL